MALESALESGARPANGFLWSLTPDDFELIRAHLRTVDLVHDTVLVRSGETLNRAYLPHRGIISLIVDLAKGEHVQVAMIGRDSVFGVASTLGDPVALNNAVVQLPGVASMLEIERLRAAADESATLRALLVRHGLATYAQIQQTAACNAAHSVKARLARCLLQIQDLSGGNQLVLTQEALAQMIGARRNSVSLVASMLQEANCIQYSRGHIDILNREGLKKIACECYASVSTHHKRLLQLDSEELPRARAG